jgi:hypothetical protein
VIAVRTEEQTRRYAANRKQRYAANPEGRRRQLKDRTQRKRDREREALLQDRKFVVSGIRKHTIKRRAKRFGWSFAIEGMVLDVPERCPLAGIPLDGRDRDHTPTIDRVDNSRGYEPDNVWVISYFANRIKRNFDLETAKRKLARKAPTLH